MNDNRKYIGRLLKKYLNIRKIFQFDKIIKWFGNLSVVKKFMVSYCLILSIPLIIIGVYIYSSSVDSAIREAHKDAEQTTSTIYQSILEKKASIEYTSQFLNNSNVFRTFITSFKGENKGFIEYLFQISPLIEETLAYNPLIYSSRVYTSNTYMLERWDVFYSIDQLEAQDEYAAIKNKFINERLWRRSRGKFNPGLTNPKDTPDSPPDKDTDTPNRNIDIDEKIPTNIFIYNQKIVDYYSRQVIALIEIEITEEVLFSSLAGNIENDIGKVFIIDENGFVISNNVPDYYEKSIELDYSNEAIESGIQIVENEKSVVVIQPIEELRSNIVFVIPEKIILGNIRSSAIIISLLVLSAGILIGITIYFITSRLLKRLKILTNIMKKYDENELRINVQIKYYDEIGELANAFNNMIIRIRYLINTVYKSQIMEKEAELKALENQIDPHFLYNTIASISILASKNEENDIYYLSNALARFYRLMLNKGVSLISVKNEIEIVKTYMLIQKIRMGEWFDVYYDVDEGTYRYNMIKYILQPIVENVLVHGIDKEETKVNIQIRVRQLKEDLLFQVIDDGVGISKDLLEKIMNRDTEDNEKTAFAINNIDERIKHYYGTEYGVEIQSEPGKGTEVSILISKEMNHHYKRGVKH